MRHWLAAAALAATPALAHRGHDAISVVTVEADGAVSVSHRFEAHDIEPALAKIAPGTQPSLDDADAIAGLQAYLARRFEMTADGRPVALAFARTDLSTAEVRVEFAGRVARPPKTVAVRATILNDVYPRQRHQVNVRVGGVVRTLTLAGGAAQAARF